MRSIVLTRAVRLVLGGLSAAAVVVEGAWVASPVAASPLSSPGSGVGTALPPGWELCILQGVGAPATQDNVADLDEWQTAEGGSTNNTAAFNPYNTLRMTDASGTPVPGVVSPNGFPAYATWAAGCAATVATLLQPNMAPIVVALKAGEVSPPGAFLFDVDESQWCAPSNGIPCYASEILSGIGAGAVTNLIDDEGPFQDALKIFTNTSAALSTYDQDVSATAADSGQLEVQTGKLSAAESALSSAEAELSSSDRSLRQVAIDDYMTNGAVTPASDLKPFGAPDQQAVLAQMYRNVADSAVVGRFERAEADVQTWVSRRFAAEVSVAEATSVLHSALATESQALTRLDSDMNTLETAGACVGASPVTSPANPAAASGSNAQAGVEALQTCLTSLSPPATAPPATAPPATAPPATAPPATAPPATAP
ncbi:MAG: hypothetical protein ACRD6W_13135, partial [Nitrososphaerales archaeon]